jgi:hypothetical protein
VRLFSAVRLDRATRRALACLFVLMASLFWTRHARSEFANVINVPPDLDPFSTIRSNTQVNLREGGNILYYTQLGASGFTWPFVHPETSSHIELNVYGGSVDGSLQAGSPSGMDSDIVVNLYSGWIGNFFRANGGTTVNIFGGSVGDYFTAGPGGPPWWPWLDPPPVGNPVVVNLSGGSIGRSFVVSGVLNMTGGYIGEEFGGAITFNMSGGVVDSEVRVQKGNVANISGGLINSYLGVDGVANVSGGTFGYVNTGRDSQLNLIGGDFRLNGAPISGLSHVGDAVPFNFPQDGLLTGTLADGTPIAIVRDRWDYVPDGTVTLKAANVPPVTKRSVHVPADLPPLGIRAGQSLTLADGGAIGNNFTASSGSTFTMTGGEVGLKFEAVGSLVNISGGSIGGEALATSGAVVNVSGGSIGSNFYAGRGSTVNVTGGKFDQLFETADGSVVNFSGGNFADYIFVHPGTQFTISGGEFRLDGTPISGLSAAGSTKLVDIQAGSVLSGVLADGRSFAFSTDNDDYFAPGTLTLKSSSIPARGPALIHVQNDPAPIGLRGGQMLLVDAGGAVGDDFNANWGSSVVINGGKVGRNFEAVGSVVNISGGEIGGGFDALFGSLVNITGGTIGGSFAANRGSVVNISGGSLDQYVHARSGSVVNVSGGSIGPYSYVFSGSTLNISGGSVDRELNVWDGVVNISGGTVGSDFYASAGSTVNISGGAIAHSFHSAGSTKISGSDFRLNGVPITGLETYAATAFEIPAGSVLSGTLWDGTPFSFSDQASDWFEKGSLRLERYPAAPASAANTVLYAGIPAPARIGAGQFLVVGAGGKVGDYFRAGWGSSLTVLNGTIGDYSDAIGAHVLIASGVVGHNFNAFYGSEVTISGGWIDNFFSANRGSVVNLLGGTMSRVTASAGSVLNVSGGTINSLGAMADSEVHFFGYGFRLDDVPIANLIPGQMLEITQREVTLRGYLADGSPFSFFLRANDSYQWDHFDTHALISITSVLEGDYNDDGVVDAADYVMWRRGAGTTYAGSNYSSWRAHLGQRLGATVNMSVGDVPEAGCPGLAIWTVLSWWSWSRRVRIRDSRSCVTL